MYLAAKELGVTISDLTDDTYYRQDEDFISRIKRKTKRPRPIIDRSLPNCAPAGIRTLDTLIKSQLL